MNPLAEMLHDGRRALGFFDHIAVGADMPHARTQQAAASMRTLSLSETDVPIPMPVGLGRATYSPAATEAGKVTKLDGALIAASRSMQAGAALISVPLPATGAGFGVEFGTSDVFVMQRREASFDVIEAAPFAVVEDGDDVAALALPISRHLVDMDTIPAFGFRVELSRADQKKYGDGLLSDCALVSIALGLARAADAVLLAAIAASAPASFSLAKASARGVYFAELRALIGTAGTGADVGADGALRAAGVAAELTPDTAGTYVGSFGRSAVAISEDVRLIAERTNVAGDLVLTCWANMQALIDTSAFWSVAA